MFNAIEIILNELGYRRKNRSYWRRTRISTLIMNSQSAEAPGRRPKPYSGYIEATFHRLPSNAVYPQLFQILAGGDEA